MGKLEHSKTQEQIDGLGVARRGVQHDDDDVAGHAARQVVEGEAVPSVVPGQEPGPKLVS